jgi:flagellar hook protein FlgE
MSFGTYLTGLSGIKANGDRLSMIGNNIANINTIGFKENRLEFANLVRNSLVGERGVVAGNGVAVTGASLNWGQGALAHSNNPMDWAIDGNGFFVVEDSAGNSYYTRNGQLALQTEGSSSFIANTSGYILQGYVVDEEGNIGSELTALEIQREMPAKATTATSMVANLDASSPIIEADFDPDDASTYTFSASQVIYDSSDGEDASHTLTTYFVKTDENIWDVHVRVDDGEATAAGQLEFDTDGEMLSGAEQSVTVTVPIAGDGEDVPDSTLSQAIAMDFTGTTQYGSDSASLSQSQDGYNGGDLQTVTLGRSGIVYGNFSNQRQQAVGQVGLASFESPWGLRQTGGGLFVASDESGEATVVKPGTEWSSGNPSVGDVRSGALELSNVEVTNNFVDMISTQFGFQANSKAIMAADEVLQQAINLKR